MTHYKNLFNIEFPWDEYTLSKSPATAGRRIKRNEEMVGADINHMKVGKAPSGILIEMIRTGGDKIVTALTTLINQIIKHRSIPLDWELSYIINCLKEKGKL